MRNRMMIGPLLMAAALAVLILSCNKPKGGQAADAQAGLHHGLVSRRKVLILRDNPVERFSPLQPLSHFGGDFAEAAGKVSSEGSQPRSQRHAGAREGRDLVIESHEVFERHRSGSKCSGSGQDAPSGQRKEEETRLILESVRRIATRCRAIQPLPTLCGSVQSPAAD